MAPNATENARATTDEPENARTLNRAASMSGLWCRAQCSANSDSATTDPISAVSLGMAFALGPAGLPHVLMRFFTVKDARSARQSLSYATTLIALFQLIVILLGYAAAALVPATGLPGGTQ